MNIFSKFSAKLMLTLPLAWAASACSLMHDDLPDCATAPEVCAAVNFIYDYNTELTDRFHDHIGSVTLYVFDANNRLVRSVEHTASADDLHADDHRIILTLPAGTYSLYASARQSADGYEAAMAAGEGAKFRRAGLAEGASLGDITYNLDHTTGTVDHGGAPLEHLWLTHRPQQLVIPVAAVPAEGDPQPDDIVVEATVPLQRVSNDIHVTVTRSAARASRDDSPDYDVWIETADGRHQLDLAGNTTAAAAALTYTPYTTSADAPLRADFSTSKLVDTGSSATNDRLCVRSHATGEVFTFDLPAALARGNDAYAAMGWSAQEYLDRAFDHDIQIAFRDDDSDWEYIQINIAILNWSKRIQNVDL